MAQTSKTLRINGRFLEFSHPDKPYFPQAQDGLKKEDVVDYYRRIAEVMPANAGIHLQSSGCPPARA